MLNFLYVCLFCGVIMFFCFLGCLDSGFWGILLISGSFEIFKKKNND